MPFAHFVDFKPIGRMKEFASEVGEFGISNLFATASVRLDA